MSKRFWVWIGVFVFALLFVLVQPGVVQEKQTRDVQKKTITAEKQVVDPAVAKVVEDIKFYRSTGDNAKAAELLKSISKNTVAAPTSESGDSKPDNYTVTPISGDQKNNKGGELWNTTDVPVSTSSAIELFPSMDVRSNSANDTEMYNVLESWNGNTAPLRLKLSRSMNHGQNWNEAWLLQNGSYELTSPTVKQVDDDHIGVVFTRKFSSGDYDVHFWRAKVTDFSENLYGYPDNSGGTVDRYPAMTSDYPYWGSPGWVYIAYYRMAGTSSQLRFVKSTDGGVTFEDSSPLATFTSQPTAPWCSIFFKNDVLWLAYTYTNSSGKSSVALIKSTDWGDTWSSPVVMWSDSSLPAYYPSVAAADANKAWVAYNVNWGTDWDTYYAYTTNGGSTWGSSSLDGSSAQDTAYPKLGYMGGSNVYITYYLWNGYQVILQKTATTAPTSWSSQLDIKNRGTSLVSQPAILVSQNPSGTYQGSVSWADVFNPSPADYDVWFNAEWLPLASATSMGVVPTANFYSAGLAGGPFSPVSMDYLIQNTGTASISWTVATNRTWLSPVSGGGTLGPGNATTLTVSINSGANSLAAGDYTGTVTFTNTTNGVGNTTRTVYLHVGAPGTLSVTAGNIVAWDIYGWIPWTVWSKTYTLTNTGGAPLNWTAAKTKNWVSLSTPASGTLNAAASTTLNVALNVNIWLLSPPATYSDTVTFTNTTNGLGTTTRTVTVTMVYNQYVTVQGSDNYIYSRAMDTSEGLSAWTKLNGKTNVTPATAVFNGKLYMVVKSDTDNTIWYNTMTPDGVWGSWAPMDGFTTDKPSIAAFNNKLYITVRGTDNKIYFRSMSAGGVFSSWNLVPLGLTSVPPVIHAFNGMLYLVVKDSGDNKIWWNKMNTSDVWAGWNLMDGLSPSTAALTTFTDGNLYIAVRGADDKIYGRAMSTADAFTAWVSIPGYTTTSPAMEAYNGKIYLVVKSNVDMKIWWNSMNASYVWGSFAPMDGLTPTTPSVAATLY